MPAAPALVRLTLTVLAAGLAACTGTPASAPTGDLDLTAYPPCAAQPAAPELDDVPGLILPAEAITFSQRAVGPLTQVEGVVPLTPMQARAFYETSADLEVLSVEDERVETEVLVTDGTHRMFVKVQIVCAGGSNFTATIGAEADSPALPTPAGRPGGG